MKKIYFLTLLLVITGCTTVQKEDLQNLNGYWEITKVFQPDGKEVDFSMNTIYDFYEIDEEYKGMYKKASPQLDGTFIVDEYQEEIEIIEDQKDFKIKFHSEFDDRELTIVEITGNKLVLKNPEQKTYYYKKAEPINLLKNEE